MLHFGLGGVFGGPRQVREPEPLRFRQGEVWRSPKGVVYEVVAGDWMAASLRNIRTGRTYRRSHELINNKSWERLEKP